MLLHVPPMEGHGDQPKAKNGPALVSHGAEAVRQAITPLSALCPTNCAVLSPGTKEPRWPGTLNSVSILGLPSTSATPTALGKGGPTRTRTAYCASIFLRGPTSPGTAPMTWPPLPTH
jgi:hypothetical protein